MPPHHIAIVGASLAGLRAVEAATRLGYHGRLTLVGAERHLPYDRPPLSKDFLARDSSRAAPWLPAARDLAGRADLDLFLGVPATGLDVASRRLILGDREIAYDALLVTTGAEARMLPGAEQLDGVHCLRTLDDAARIRHALDAGARTVVVGAGFIGSEVASAARKRGLDVTVLEAQATPLARSVGVPAGRALARLHAQHGTDLRCGVRVTRLLGERRVEGVELDTGTALDADLVVVGIGARPATGWLEGSGLHLDDGLVCDSTLAAGPSVWAAGDIARWDAPDLGVLLRVEHWTNAGEMAATAVSNILNPAQARLYRHVPYFWSDWYGSRIQFVGLPEGDPEVVTGRWDASAFVALYRRGERLIGALALNRRGDIMKYRALIARGASWDDALGLAATRGTRSPVGEPA